MKSNFVKKIILLKQMLDDMEQDVGLASLSCVEKKCLFGCTRYEVK